MKLLLAICALLTCATFVQADQRSYGTGNVSSLVQVSSGCSQSACAAKASCSTAATCSTSASCSSKSFLANAHARKAARHQRQTDRHAARSGCSAQAAPSCSQAPAIQATPKK